MQDADQIADKWLTRSVYDHYYKKSTDIRDMLKQCPKCGIIWMKDNFCNNNRMYCGNRPYNYFDYFSNKSSYRYCFSIEKDKLTYTKNEMKKMDQLQL